MIPFLDLNALHRPIRDEILQAWSSVLDSNRFAGGPVVESFESEFSGYVGVRHGIGVSSGTDALRLALMSLGLQHGDEVITVPHTFIATTEAITQAGGRPVFVDVDQSTGTLDPSLLEPAITSRTRVVLPVHLYGQPADMDRIMEIALRHDLKVLEDAAQAHGARYHGRMAGSIGDAAAFSFYPGKNLGACGEAGIVTTDDEQVAERVRILRDHGQPAKYRHDVEGYNSRLDALQAAVLKIKLRYLDDWNEARRRCAEWYAEGLGSTTVRLPGEVPGRKHVYHLYVVRHPERDRIVESLGKVGIGTGLHYPIPLHLQPAYRRMGHGAGSFPVSEEWAGHGLSLPIFPDMTRDQVENVCEALRNLD